MDFGVRMDVSQIWIAVSIIVLAVVDIFNKSKAR